MKYKLLFLVVSFVILVSSISFVNAVDVYISNSADWKDVYSVSTYASLLKKPSFFLVSDRHYLLILNDIKKEDNVKIISSSENMFTVGFASYAKSLGYNADETVYNDNINLELAAKLRDEDAIKNYIIMDDTYGYNAVAVATYANLARYYVLFASRENVNDIRDFLDSVNGLDNVIVYGTVDREVLTMAQAYNPEIINNDGDRFANNVEIVKKYMAINPSQQVLLTNGEFIEAELVGGNYPVLFIGAQNVPDTISSYIKSTNITVGVLVGNELVNTATTVRRQAGIAAMVKFARGARQRTSGISQVEGLDLFYLPKYNFNINITGVRYNILTKQIEISMENIGDVAAYFKGTYTLTFGSQRQVFSDADPVFIEQGDQKTVVFDADGITDTDNPLLNILVVFGESKNSLERMIDGAFPVDRVDIADNSNLNVTKVMFDSSRKEFVVEVKNLGDEPVYASAEIRDFLLLRQTVSFGTTSVKEIPKGGTLSLRMRPASTDLVETDLEENPLVHVVVTYGSRENALIKRVDGKYTYSTKGPNYWIYIPTVIIILLLLLLIMKARTKKHA